MRKGVDHLGLPFLVSLIPAAPEVNETMTFSFRADSSPVMRAATRPTEDFSLSVSISYAGEPPCKYLLPEGEYLFTSVPESLNSPTRLKRVVLMAPVKMADELKQETVERLLKDLVKGIMVASNHGGIFIRCRDKVCISWSGFLAPEGQIIENNTHQQLFKSQEFRSALELYQEGRGPLPDPRVILYLGDEADGNGHMGCKPIIIQDILSYILVRVPPEVPGGPKPRFSLYLSSQLQFEEMQYIMEHLNQINPCQKISLNKPKKTEHLQLPNELKLMDILEKAPNPFFGSMEPLLPCPDLMP
ncbi:putative Interferon-stimulated transcription factor 3 gamma 48kDa protein, partial [Naja naja]